MLSMRHSNVSRAGGVWSSVPLNSKIVELLPFAGARSSVVSGGVSSKGSSTSHS